MAARLAPPCARRFIPSPNPAAIAALSWLFHRSASVLRLVDHSHKSSHAQPGEPSFLRTSTATSAAMVSALFRALAALAA